MSKGCTFYDCPNDHQAQGLCPKHYSRFKRHGKPEGRTSVDRLMAMVKVDPLTECWQWQGGLESGGYGSFKPHTDRPTQRAHRAAYELLVGPIPDGLHLDHLCHTNDDTCLGGTTCLHRRCVNPAHLEPVDPAENARRGKSPTHMARRAGSCQRNHDPSELVVRRRGNGQTFMACRACCRLTAALLRAARRDAA